VFEVLKEGRAVALVRPENGPSIGVATKLGLRPERSIPYAGYDHIVFSMPNPGGLPPE
jgi:RimJ/RimL family protein N-acetyltransferase